MTTTDKSVEPKASTQGSRQVLVSLYVQGSTNDAKAMYGSSPGATDAGWQALERMLTPVKQFISDGGMPYVVPDTTTEYAGIPVPEPESEETEPEPPETRSSGEFSPAPVYQEPVSKEKTEDKPVAGTSSASDLIAQAKSAKTAEELDRIEQAAGNRVTILDAVDARREELKL